MQLMNQLAEISRKYTAVVATIGIFTGSYVLSGKLRPLSFSVCSETDTIFPSACRVTENAIAFMCGVCVMHFILRILLEPCIRSCKISKTENKDLPLKERLLSAEDSDEQVAQTTRTQLLEQQATLCVQIESIQKKLNPDEILQTPQEPLEESARLALSGELGKLQAQLHQVQESLTRVQQALADHKKSEKGESSDSQDAQETVSLSGWEGCRNRFNNSIYFAGFWAWHMLTIDNILLGTALVFGNAALQLIPIVNEEYNVLGNIIVAVSIVTVNVAFYAMYSCLITPKMQTFRERCLPDCLGTWWVISRQEQERVRALDEHIVTGVSADPSLYNPSTPTPTIV